MKFFFYGISDFFKSGFMFFFRWPVFAPRKFYSSSILLGPVLQGAVFFCAAYCFQFFSLSNSLLLSFVVLSVWTGFFHDDGFADTCDSLGVSLYSQSKENIEKIKLAMKDSRLGAFGVSGLALMWLFRFIACSNAHLNLVSAALIVAVSRSSGLLAAKLVSLKISTHHEGIQFTANPYFFLNFGLFFAALVFQTASWVPFLLGAILGGISLWYVSRRTQELSGDVIGFCIILTELLMFFQFF
jgi:cobalamin synthase